MRGPFPSYRPEFPSTCVEQAATMAWHRTVPYQLRQRAALGLLLSQQPLVSNSEAAQRVPLHPRSGRRWRYRWATGDFALDDKPGRGRKAAVSPAGSCPGQGGRLGTGRRNPAPAEPPVPGRRHGSGPYGAGHTDQSQHGVADSCYGCHQTLAVQVLDFSPCSPRRQPGRPDAGPLGGPVARRTPGAQGPHPQRRGEAQHPGPPPWPSLSASRTEPSGLARERIRAWWSPAISGCLGRSPGVCHGPV